jgi:hypothetical protein
VSLPLLGVGGAPLQAPDQAGVGQDVLHFGVIDELAFLNVLQRRGFDEICKRSTFRSGCSGKSLVRRIIEAYCQSLGHGHVLFRFVLVEY